MVDWSEELGIDMRTLMLEAFWHPVAQWENDRIRQRGEDYWEWYRHTHPEQPSRMAMMDANPRPRFKFTERQLELAIRSLDEDGKN